MIKNIKALGMDFAKFLSQVPRDLRTRIAEDGKRELIRAS